MYISVIPLSHSLSTEPYTYLVAPVWEESICLGALVEIPLGRYVVKGIIASRDITLDPSIGEIRPIMAVISSVPLISDSMVDMVIRIARRYSLPIHKVLSLFLPAPLLSRLDKKNYLLEEINTRNDENKKTPIRQIHHSIDTIFSKEDILKYMTPGTVFAFPDDFFLFSFFPDRDKRDTPYTLSTISNESTPTKKSQNWIDIYEGKYDILA